MIMDEGAACCYVLTNAEVQSARGTTKQLSVTRKRGGVSEVRNELLPHSERWDRIKAFSGRFDPGTGETGN